MLPATFVFPCFTKKLLLFNVVESMTSLKVAEINVFKATAVAPLVGTVETTIGHIPVVPGSSNTFLQPVINKSGKINAREIFEIVFVIDDCCKRIALKKNNFFFMRCNLGKRLNFCSMENANNEAIPSSSKKRWDLIESLMSVLTFKMMYLSGKKNNRKFLSNLFYNQKNIHTLK